MASLFPSLPALIDLTGRGVVIAAGCARAAAFARDCVSAGAGVIVVHPAPAPAWAGMERSVRFIRRRWRAADFRAAALVAVGADEPRMARARSSAKAARAIFLALDGGPESDVVLGETAALGPMTIGLWASGLPAPLAQAMRRRIERAAPARLRGFLEAAAALPGGGGADASFWRDALAAALKSDPGDWEAWLAARLGAAAASVPLSPHEKT
jgi:siroheme synthase (precorrin-2 oxidase/ferrochelatase)